VTAGKRTPLAPDVPAIAEVLPGYELIAWFGLVAPAGTPKEVVARLHDATARGIVRPEVKDRFATIGTDVAPMNPGEFSGFIKSEVAKWAKLVREAGIQPE
jgi:tripartite-type tricarboxylate transporter receptor subunit TctC